MQVQVLVLTLELMPLPPSVWDDMQVLVLVLMLIHTPLISSVVCLKVSIYSCSGIHFTP